MSNEQKIGSDWGYTGTRKDFTATISGAGRVSDAHGKYFDPALAGRIYQVGVVGGAATAYAGAAGGTPLVAVHNPANSTVVLSVIGISFGGVVAASAAGTVALRVYAGASVAPTGTQTAPRNVLSQSASGSSALGFSNTALTGSTALNYMMTLYSYYWATAAGAIAAPSYFDVSGMLIVLPGNQVAVGGSAALTSATYDCSILYEELPYFQTA